MTKLTPIKLDDNTIIYMEATEDLNVSLVSSEPNEEEEEALTSKGMSPAQLRQEMIQNFQIIQNTVRSYTIYTLNAFKQIPIANVDKVTLEFGIEMGGEAGVPYVTRGTAKSNMKITVECSFPKQVEGANG
ncbi:MAG TPA: CU044_2847 family protein [Nostocaceae cyanobacterium]|nr:CU044_2847 family protein [Nostocaceae cyanobacterium]